MIQIKTGSYMAIKSKKIAQIIKSATNEFLHKGLDAASMHNIAESAEVSKRTLYKYFPNKDELYSALIDELLDRVYENKQEYCPEQPIKEQLEQIVKNKIELFSSESFLSMSKIILGEMLKSRKPNDAQLERMYQAEVLFVGWINAGKQDNKITSTLSSEVIASQFHSILKGQTFYPVVFYFADFDNIDKQEVLDTTVSFFINSFCQ